MKERKCKNKLENLIYNNYKRIAIIKIFIIIILNLFIIFKDFNNLLLQNIIQIYNFKKIIKSKYLFKKQIEHNKKFAILIYKCKTCGLFSFYIHYLGCIKIFINKGYIPIIDLTSYPNVFNKFNYNYSNKNPWEFYFNQPYGYTLENVKKYAINKKKFICKPNHSDKPDKYSIYINKYLIYFWHNYANKYIPIQKEIINEAKIIRKKLYKGLYNVLGVLMRGTDYIAMKPKNHCIPPKIETMIEDIKDMDKKYNYDWIFVTTEDDIIRKKLINAFFNKVKYLKSKILFKYNYKKKNFIVFNENIKINYNYMKFYLINIIILSQSKDIICARTCGSEAAFILSNGFRNNKVYFLGEYK